MINGDIYIIDFEPLGRRGECRSGHSLLDCSRQQRIGIKSLCGGLGKCRCGRVQVLGGVVSSPTSQELETFSDRALGEGWRLACQTYPLSDCKIRVPPESMTGQQRVVIEGMDAEISPDPVVKSYDVVGSPPTLKDTRADCDRLLAKLNEMHFLECDRIDLEVQRTLSPRLRAWDWQCRSWVREREVVAIGSGKSKGLGISVDLGTTKIAAYLVDLISGKTLEAKGAMNPQIAYGEDVVTRITYAIKSAENASRLRQAAVDALNRLIAELCASSGTDPEEIVEGVIVGNTAMHHLLLGFPVRQLALAPYVPAVSRAMDVKSRDVGLHIAPGAYIHFPPNIAGFVGADHVAMLLATEVHCGRGLTVALDIGTNTEVSLTDQGRITTVSCASGPVFEGGHIRHGMRAANGAIERVILDSRAVHYETIDGSAPIGICGSGILDAIAQLYLIGVIDETGRMRETDPRVRRIDGKREFVLVSRDERGGAPDIVITQKDVRELQMGKGAVRAGIRVLLESNGYVEDEIEKVVICGAFGTYIDIPSAITIGMLPGKPVECFVQVGNAAGMGAKQVLVSAQRRHQARHVASSAHYIELATDPRFKKAFARSSYIGSYNDRDAQWKDKY